MTAIKQIQPFTDAKQHHLSFSLVQTKDKFISTKPVRVLGKVALYRIDIPLGCKNHCIIGIGDNLTMRKGTIAHHLKRR